MPDPVLKVENLSKKFCRSLRRSLWYGTKDLVRELLFLPGDRSTLQTDEFWALRDVSFELRRGEMVGIIGHNGAGKTTLLKLINRLMRPDQGRIEVRGRVGALIALGMGFKPILTGRENIYVAASVLGFKKAEIDSRLSDIIDFAEIGEFIDTPVQNYSSGMRVRLGFAIASSLDPDMLLIDEVLAVGDASFRARCMRRLRDYLNQGGSALLVTHNSFVVEDVCDRVLLLDHGKALGFGDPQTLVAQYLAMAEEIARSESLRRGDDLEHEGTVEFTGFESSAPAGPAQGEFQFEEPIEFKLSYEAKEPLTEAYFEFLIKKGSTDGPAFTFMSTMLDKIAPDAFPSQGEVSCILDGPPLAPGMYHVMAGVRALMSRALGKKYHAPLRDVGTFVVLPAGLEARFPGAPASYLVSGLPPLVLNHRWRLNGTELTTG